eukprot:10457271-Alexandrium_andersonii.AAC.1
MQQPEVFGPFCVLPVGPPQLLVLRSTSGEAECAGRWPESGGESAGSHSEAQREVGEFVTDSGWVEARAQHAWRRQEE